MDYERDRPRLAPSVYGFTGTDQVTGEARHWAACITLVRHGQSRARPGLRRPHERPHLFRGRSSPGQRQAASRTRSQPTSASPLAAAGGDLRGRHCLHTLACSPEPAEKGQRRRAEPDQPGPKTESLSAIAAPECAPHASSAKPFSCARGLGPRAPGLKAGQQRTGKKIRNERSRNGGRNGFSQLDANRRGSSRSTARRPCALDQKVTTRIQITRPTRTATSTSSTLRYWDGDDIP